MGMIDWVVSCLRDIIRWKIAGPGPRVAVPPAATAVAKAAASSIADAGSDSADGEEPQDLSGRAGCYAECCWGSPTSVAAAPPQDWRVDLTPGQGVACWCDGRWRKATVNAVEGDTVGLETEPAAVPLVLPRASPDLQPSMPDRAMSLAQLRRFAEDCRREVQCRGILDPRRFLDHAGAVPNPGYNQLLDFDKAPMWLVVELFIVPATRERRVPFVDLMAERWPDLGGPSTVTHFVSHSWGQCFSEDLHALSCLGDNAKLWICCFAMTQDASRLELLDDSEVFAEALTAESTRYQVLIVDQGASALSRLWVLFEVLRAHEHGKPLCIAPAEALVQSRLTFSTIQLENAHATLPADRDYILQEFEKVGLSWVNETVIRAVQKSLVFLLRKMKARHGAGSVEAASAHRHLGDYLLRAGRTHESEHHYSQALDIRLALHGEHHLEVAQAYADLGCAVFILGRYKEAEKLHKLALELRRELLASDMNVEIAQCLGDLGLVSERLGRSREAESYHRRALEIRAELLGEDSLKVATSCFNLAHVVSLWDREEALQLHRRALGIRLKMLSGSDITTAHSMSNVAHVLWLLGRLDEAEVEFRRALAVHLEQLPRGHPLLAQVYGNLGLLYTDQGRLEEAEELHLKALHIRVAARGETHAAVARSYGALGVVYSRAGRLAEAKAAHRRALALRVAAFGSYHHEVARSHSNLGTVLSKQGRFALAEKEHRRALLIRVLAFASRPSLELSQSHSDLAEVLRQLDRPSEASVADERAGKVSRLVAAAGTPTASIADERAGKVSRLVSAAGTPTAAGPQ